MRGRDSKWHRAHGYMKCAFATVVHTYDNPDLPYGSRVHAKKRGEQCANWVRRAVWESQAIPICAHHIDHYEKLVAEKIAAVKDRNAAMRLKYDPGPLPLDDNE